MNFFRIKIADKVAEIVSTHRVSASFFRPFLTDTEPDYIIELDNVAFKRCNIDGFSFGQEQFEEQFDSSVIHEEVAKDLLQFDVILFHGAAIALSNSAFIFSAPSSVGKTTHILKWIEHLSNAYVINGDKPFIRFLSENNQVLVCGSPWAGKENMYTNTMVPLKSIILMERAEDNHIEQISFAEAFPKLLQQVYRPEDEEKMRKTLRLMQRLNGPVSFWRFQCNNFKDDCFDVAYNALVGKQK